MWLGQSYELTNVIRDRTEEDVIPVLSTPLTLQYWVEGDQQVVETADTACQTNPLEGDESDIASEAGFSGQVAGATLELLAGSAVDFVRIIICRVYTERESMELEHGLFMNIVVLHTAMLQIIASLGF